MFGNILDFVVSIYTVTLCRLHRIFWGLAETAYQVSSAILGLKGVTSIVVTHSLDEALLKQYDGIITLKNGSIVETGTFGELIAEKGYFYSLFTISQ